ncbi:hypothetical protein FNV43_RR26489 [Rhamnella rubrinervis]|uniref:non-specific serine/threonine protein kinase n=1 Tax=Rhamnella rubrinervis TaxID=2594499 RepID=A0A8K0DMN8_9ROSA|nr:hypothetical protein FNV43_RR26489 [Rhamnella rubrinervis]
MRKHVARNNKKKLIGRALLSQQKTGISPVVRLRFLEMALGPLFFLFVLTHLVLLNSAEEEKHHPHCEPFQCGKLGEIRWPYKEKKHPHHCGLYTVDCSEENSPKIQLKKEGHWYQISKISQADSIFINDTELRKTLTSRSCESLEKFGLPSPSLLFSPFKPNIVNLFKCNSSIHITLPTAFYSTNCGHYNLFYTLIPNSSLDYNLFPPQCSFIQLPANNTGNVHSDLFEFQLASSFYLHVEVIQSLECFKCQERGGECLLADSKKQFRCTKGLERKPNANSHCLTGVLSREMEIYMLSLGEKNKEEPEKKCKIVAVFVVFVLTHLVLLYTAEEDPQHGFCPKFYCEKLGSIGTPFYNFRQQNHCDGGYPVDCREPNNPKIQLIKEGHWYKVTGISQGNSIHINDRELQNEVKFGRCKSLESYGLPSPSLFINVTSRRTLNLFKCSHSFHNITSQIGFYNTTCGDYNIYYYTNTTHPIYNNSFPSFPQHNCSFIQLPASDHTGNPNSFSSFLPADILLQVLINIDCLQCRHSPHSCLFDFKSQTHYCANKDTGDNGWRRRLKFVVATTSAGLVLMVFLCCLIRKFSAFNFIYLWKEPNQAHQNVEAFLKQHGPLPTRRYSYSDVKQMANNFIDKIGQGGYGCVYKGKLKNGRLIAVKVLNKSKGNGEEFINEVATISRTSHVNVVSLLGFCFEGPKRALIYEFMPNGSLEKFIFKDNGSQNENLQLEWGTLYQISLGIARGLEYLHRGCSTRILHFDIKLLKKWLQILVIQHLNSPIVKDGNLGGSQAKSLVELAYGNDNTSYRISSPGVLDSSGYKVTIENGVMKVVRGVTFDESRNLKRKLEKDNENLSTVEFVDRHSKEPSTIDHLDYESMIKTKSRVRWRFHHRTTRVYTTKSKGTFKPRYSDMMTMKSEEDDNNEFVVHLTDPSSSQQWRVIEMLEGSLDCLQVPPKPFFMLHNHKHRVDRICFKDTVVAHRPRILFVNVRVSRLQQKNGQCGGIIQFWGISALPFTRQVPTPSRGTVPTQWSSGELCGETGEVQWIEFQEVATKDDVLPDHVWRLTEDPPKTNEDDRNSLMAFDVWKSSDYFELVGSNSKEWWIDLVQPAICLSDKNLFTSTTLMGEVVHGEFSDIRDPRSRKSDLEDDFWKDHDFEQCLCMYRNGKIWFWFS